MRAAIVALLLLVGCGERPDPYAQIAPIIAKHCKACHSDHPTHSGFDAPPVGVAFDSPAEVKKYAARIRVLAVTTDVMPLGNETGITRAERDALGRWIDSGAPIGREP